MSETLPYPGPPQRRGVPVPQFVPLDLYLYDRREVSEALERARKELREDLRALRSENERAHREVITRMAKIEDTDAAEAMRDAVRDALDENKKTAEQTRLSARRAVWLAAISAIFSAVIGGTVTLLVAFLTGAL